MVLDHLRRLNYEGYATEFIETGKKQLTSAQANRSQKVTKIRYAVEMTKSKIKTCFEFFEHKAKNRALDHDFVDFCALVNAFTSQSFRMSDVKIRLRMEFWMFLMKTTSLNLLLKIWRRNVLYLLN